MTTMPTRRATGWAIVHDEVKGFFSNVCWSRKEAWQDFLAREIGAKGGSVRWDYDGEPQACGFKAQKVYVRRAA